MLDPSEFILDYQKTIEDLHTTIIDFAAKYRGEKSAQDTMREVESLLRKEFFVELKLSGNLLKDELKKDGNYEYINH